MGARRLWRGFGVQWQRRLCEYGTEPAQRSDYWRVDEVNGAPDNTVFKGAVWSFTTEPIAIPIETITATASGANPGMDASQTVDGSGLNDQDEHSALTTGMWQTLTDGSWIQYEFDRAYKLHALLVWNSNQSIESFIGFGVNEAVIETSMDGAVWTAVEGVPPFARAPGQGGYRANTTVDLSGIVARYVKITPQTAYGVTGQIGLSEVRFLAIPTYARDKQPQSASPVVGPDVTLSWRAGREAVAHQVFLGTDADGLSVLGTVTDSWIATGPLNYATTYYWSVTEVNEAEAVSSYAGDIMSFTTPDSGVVDDFESYSGNAGEEVFMTWLDGYGGDASLGGSTTGHIDGPFVETAIVSPTGGQQAMPFYYDNNGGFVDIDGKVSSPQYSEIVREFVSAQDWTASGVKSLSLALRGTNDNTGQLYLKINDTKIVYSGDASTIARSVWQPWNIDLTAVSGLRAVTRLTIGVEGTNSAGLLYIDAIRLHPILGEPLAPSDPGPSNLVAHYALEGNTSDRSGNKFHGIENGQVAYGPGVEGQALVLDGIDATVTIDGVGITGAAPRTLSGWVKAAKTGITEWTGVFGFTGGEVNGQHFDIQVVGDTNSSTLGYYGIHFRGDEYDIIPLDEEWHHMAATYTDTTLTVFGDGVLVNTVSLTPGFVDTTGPLHIGKRPDYGDYFPGQVDEVRVYDQALTWEEVAWLAGHRNSMQKPL
jgi:hypothetical protein